MITNSSGAVTSSIAINNGNALWNSVVFYHGGDPETQLAPTVMPQKVDLPPPPPPIQQMPAVPKADKPLRAFGGLIGDEQIDNDLKANLQHKADFAQGIVDDAITLADTAAGMTLPGGLYEAYQGETVFGGVPLSNQQRAIAATFTALPVGGVFAKAGGKGGGEIIEGATKGVSKHVVDVTSNIKAHKGLVRAAEDAGKNSKVQKDLDNLVAQLRNGNMNPGKGNKHLFNGIFEARGENGGRVYFQNVGNGIVIVGKSDKTNQPQVIKILRNLYGN